MAAMQKLCVLLSAFLLIGMFSDISATVITLKNSCSDTVWAGTLAGDNGPVLGDGGFALSPGATNQVTAPAGWSGRFWGRTGCNFDDAGNGHCTTGDCGGTLKCRGGGVPPVSLVEFTIGRDSSAQDFYDVSLVDGYNVGIGVQPSGGSGNCQYAGCSKDLNGICPKELQVVDGSGTVVACKSACEAFKKPEYCCTGDYGKPETCPPTDYSKIFKSACPTAYSYAYDDESSTFTCTGADYLITFCPKN